MKLIYRGQAYEISASVQFGTNAAEPEVKLIYRGCTYYTTLHSVTASEAIEPDGKNVTLIYRSNIYKRKLQISKLYKHHVQSTGAIKFLGRSKCEAV